MLILPVGISGLSTFPLRSRNPLRHLIQKVDLSNGLSLIGLFFPLFVQIWAFQGSRLECPILVIGFLNEDGIKPAYLDPGGGITTVLLWVSQSRRVLPVQRI